MQLLFDSLSLGSLYALVGLGIGLLFGVLKVVNFAYGDLITVGAYSLILPAASATSTLFLGSAPWFVVVLGAMIVVSALALLADRLILRPLRHADPSTVMIATFALGYFLQHAILIGYGGLPRIVDFWSGLNVGYSVMGARTPLLQLITIGLTLGLLLGLIVLLRYTRIGLEIRAASENFVMARCLGIPAARVITVAIIMSAALAASVALVVTVQTGVIAYRMGVPLMIFGFIATVIGGMGSLSGAVLGGFALGVLTVLMQVLLPDDLRGFRDAIVFSIVFSFLILRPQGLFAQAAKGDRV